MKQIKIFIFIFLFIVFIKFFIIDSYEIPTCSMQPTLYGIYFKDINFDYKNNNQLRKFFDYIIFAKHITKFDEIKSEYLKEIAKNNKNDKKITYLSTVFNLYNSNSKNTEMETYLGDRILVHKIIYYIKNPERGDIIVFNSDNIEKLPQQKQFVKRIVGLPNEELYIDDDMLYIKTFNSKDFIPIIYLDKRFKKIYFDNEFTGYKSAGILMNKNKIKIPDNCYFVLGDNTLESNDSRYWGVINKKNIMGKVIFIFWPFSKRWGMVY